MSFPSNVLRFTRHKLAPGSFASCTTCGGAEASLPSDCPGFRMSYEMQDAIVAGRLNFSRKDGWIMRTKPDHRWFTPAEFTSLLKKVRQDRTQQTTPPP